MRYSDHGSGPATPGAHAWDAERIEVRLYAGDTAAVIRYRSELQVEDAGDRGPRRRYWHTDLYERRDGRCQVVWSHATEIT